MPTMPAITKRPARTKRAANQQYAAVLRAYKRAYAGGGAFGWDWPTLRLNWPEAHSFLQQLKDRYYKLPE